VEQAARVGGAGVISGTVPSETLRETALALSGWRSRKLFGVDLSLPREATVADFTPNSRRCCRRAFTPFRKSAWSGRRSKR
jgi:NAD(P) transhydrogenase